MEINDLKAIIKRGDLVNMNISTEGTQKSFVEVCDLIQEQRFEIEQIKIQLETFLTKKDFDDFQTKNSLAIQKANRAIPQFEENLKLTLNDMETKNDALRQEIHETLSSVLTSIDDKIEMGIMDFKDDIDTIKGRFDDMEPRIVAIFQQLQQDSSKPLSLAPNKDALQGLQKKLAAIEKKIGEIEMKSATQEDLKAAQKDIEEKVEHTVTTQLEPSIALIQSLSQSRLDRQGLRASRTPSQTKLPVSQVQQTTPQPVQQLQSPATSLASSPGISIPTLQSPSLQSITSTPPHSSITNTPQSAFGLNSLPIDTIMEDDPPPEDSIEGILEQISTMETKIEENNKTISGRIDRKADLSIVEHMFEKLRTLIASIKDEINKNRQKIETLVSKDEMEVWISKTLAQLGNEENQTPFQTDPYTITSNAVKVTRPTTANPKKTFKVKKTNPSLNN